MSLSIKEVILREIQANGKLTFAKFMDLVLFAPDEGYYSSGSRLSPSVDYFTSPQAHPIFGALLYRQLEQMWDLLEHPHPFTVLELGGGNGLLARDLLIAAADSKSSFSDSLQYIVSDRQEGMLLQSAHASGAQKVITNQLPFRKMVGCIISNELLDAFPVHRFRIHSGQVQELYVGSDGNGELVEVTGIPSTPLLAQRLRDLGIRLEDGFVGEINLNLRSWMEDVSQTLDRGFVITIDYGHLAHVLYSKQRSSGTLRCYYRHTLNSNPYAHVGDQDITSHVDFTTLIKEGDRRGVHTIGLTTQATFLSNLGAAEFHRALTARDMPQSIRSANQMAIRSLLQLEGLGGLRVLIQGKDIFNPQLHGLTSNNPLVRGLRANFRTLTPPLLTSDHVPLLAGAYPHLLQESAWEAIWNEHISQ